jgi:Uma2 family endonuclease
MVTQIAPSIPLPAEQNWPPQGQWTYEDYLRLPDDGNRYEIIEGVLYVANAPSYEHQFTTGEIFGELRNFVKSKSLGVVIAAPFEIHLPGIAKPVQPDVVFIAAARQPASETQIFEGAPDLVVEVISPSSLRVDRYVKLGAYERAKVREYWLVDPKTRSIEIYSLPAEGPEYILLGQFTARERLKSAVLAGLELSVESLFAPSNL